MCGVLPKPPCQPTSKVSPTDPSYPGKVSAPLYVGDWLPTLAGLAGFRPEKDPQWDGLDRWKVISGDEASPAARTVYIAHSQGQALLHDDWKVICMKKGAALLFDLGQDPYEKTDLAATRADKLKEMLALLDAQLAKDDKVMPADLKGLPH